MGGLARRASMIDTIRDPKEGLVVLDIGDSLAPINGSLFEEPLPLRPQAETMLQALGIMGTDVLVPGEVELALGLPWLAEQARFAGVTLMAANLAPRRGKSLLVPGRLVETGGVKVGLFGVVDHWDDAGAKKTDLAKLGLRDLDARKAAARQVRALQRQGAELVVMLAHMPLERAETLLGEVKGIHVALLGHGGLRLAEARQAGGTFLVEAGRRGRELGHVQVHLGREWKPGDQLHEDSRRFNLYNQVLRDRATLTKELARDNAHQFEQEIKGRKERLERLIKDYSQLKGDTPEHALVTTLHSLDGAVADHPAVKALLTSKRQPPRPAPRMATPSPGPTPVKVNTQQLQPMTSEQIRRKLGEAKSTK